jgi:NAD(P)-dependent dehydrogenase (short-subunit alcohol dehydrogenase family)
MAVRSIGKGEKAKSILERTTKCNPSVIEVWPLDLSSYDSVKAFGERATTELDRIDVLLENAGAASLTWSIAEDNEQMITVNVVSTILLALLLLPKLRESAKKYSTRPNLTFVVSDAHMFIDFPEKDAPEGIFNHLKDKSKAKMNDRYALSKLMEIFAIREMAERRPREEYPVTINMVNPGLCESDLAREGGNLQLKILKKALARTAEQGSRTLVHGASAGADTHSHYLNNCQVCPTASLVHSPEGAVAQKRLWKELMVKLEVIQPGVTGKL